MASDPKQIKKLYYSIGEVSRLTNLKPYVLRYWETEFKQLSPAKNRAGNRTYRQKEIETILLIKELLYEKRFTIEGARGQLASNKTPKEIVEKPDTVIHDDKSSEILVKVKQELESILDYIHKN